MKAVLSPVPEHILQWRKSTGADRYDEMWEGVMHMGPLATEDHENLRWALETYLRLRWAKTRGGKIRCMNIAPPGGWPNDYRIPDLIVWKTPQDGGNKRTHFEGPPLVVIEIYSGPDDEAYEKFPWYASLGVPEVWIIGRDTKDVDLFVLQADGYREKSPEADGWVASEATGLQMRPLATGKLCIRIGEDPSSVEEIPED